MLLAGVCQIRLRVRFQRYKDPWMDYLMVSPDEMTGLFAGSGWQVERFLTSERSSYIAIVTKE